MYTNEFKAQVLKKWNDSGKTAHLTEQESKALAEIQTYEAKRLEMFREYKARRNKRPANEVQAFDRLINNNKK